MKLTLDARLINSSGIGVYLQNLLRSERLLNYQLRILYKEEEQAFFSQISPAAEMIPFNAPLYSIEELLKTPAFTKGTDVFWSPHFNVPVINRASKLRVVTIHDVFHLAHYNTLSKGQKVYAKLMYQKAVRSSDIIFTVSETSKKEIIRYTGAKADKIKVAYNGIEFSKFNQHISQEIKTKTTNDYGIHFPFVLFVGNVKPHKNLRNGLLGFKEYLHSNRAVSSTTKFVIVGKREGFITGDTGIDALVADPVLKDKVHFTGWVKHEDLPALYQSAEAFVFPSFYEGFGFPPLEAMAAGCPVISSNASCMPEIYSDAALFFDPNNIQQIGESFHSILSDSSLRKRLVEKGFAQAKKYNWQHSMDEMFDAIERLIDVRK